MRRNQNAALLLEEARRLHRAGDLARARQLYLRLLAAEARDAEVLYLLGCEELDAGRAEAALRMSERALALDSSPAEFFLLRARALLVQGHFADAESCCQQALARDAHNVSAHLVLGDLGLDTQQYAAAEESYRRALRLDAGLSAAWSGLGRARAAVGDPVEARSCLEKAVQLDSQGFSPRVPLAVFFLEQSCFAQAAEVYRDFLAIHPGHVGALCCLSGVQYLQRDFAAARASVDAVLALAPDNAEARWNLAMLQLVQGDFAEGMKNFEARYRRFGMPEEYRRPHWHGEPLAGRSILLLDEQGLGDTIQFLRFVPRVIETGGRVMLRIAQPLRRLVESCWPSLHLLDAGEPLPASETQCPLMSLPLALGLPEAADLAALVPYLRVPEAARARARAFAWSEKKLRVGLVWAGNPAHALDRYRSLPLEELAPLFALAGVQCYSLQMGPGARQLEQGDLPIVDLRPQIDDMADTAALLEHLDLVIAVDTSAVHLAGALGRPAWMLAAAVPEWRWIDGREDSPWYPSLRIFRQSVLGDWAPVIAHVAGELRALVVQAQSAVCGVR